MMFDRLLTKLRARDEVSVTEAQALAGALERERDYPAQHVIIHENEPLTFSTLLMEGICCRYKDLGEGQRQITALHIHGDFVDLHSFTLKRLDHNVMALTRCHVGIFPHSRLQTLTEQQPHLTRLLWLSTTIDAALHREWELSLGRRNAIEKIAHLFCELYMRLELVGLAEDLRFGFPLTQAVIGECTGLTTVHVNRTLGQLRGDGLLRLDRRGVTILDWPGLVRIAEFNPNYLYLTREPR